MLLKTTNGDNLKFLIDTGANKNYISSKLVKLNRCRRTTPTRVRNVSGSHIVEKYVNFNPFPHIPHTQTFQFYVFDFHPFFDGLIGYETLQQLKAKILTSENVLEISNFKMKMQKKYPESTPLQLNANETKTISLSTNVTDGDFLIENDLEIHHNIIVHCGLYNAQGNRAYVMVSNLSNDPIKLEATGPIQVELHNFDTYLPTIRPSNMKRPVFDQLRIEHLNEEERKKLLDTIANFQDVFYVDGEDLTFTNAVKHRITTKDDLPVYTKSYRYPFCHREEVGQQISKMLEQGIIRPSSSPWSSPIWVVPKKADASGLKKWRIVIDYRKLNEKTISDRYPIPNITDILDKLGRSMYFSTLDLASGFHQIEVDERDISKTAFSVENGHYEFVRMPFGLKNAPSTFQRVMDNILREHLGIRCLVYMDDIIVFSTSLQEHIINLSKIFETLRKYNMKIQLDKSEFLRKEVAFLGHVVTADGVRTNPDKIETIKNWPLPKNEKDLRAFLGVLGYYRKFIRDFAKIAKPLTVQLRKGESIQHTKEFVTAFERCKHILSSSQVLAYPDFKKPFNLTTDASKFAIGAVLSQGPIGQDRPIAFASRTLSKSEENYSTIEKELLAIDWACKYFRPYLFGRRFTLYTDHKPLTYALNLKDPHSKLIRYKLRLEEYDYEIRHRPGKQNVVADGLSRINQELNANETRSESSDDISAHSANTDDGQFIQMTERPLNFYKNQIILEIGDRDEETYEQIFPRIFRRTITKVAFGIPFAIRLFKEYMNPNCVNCILCPEQVINTLQVAYRNYFSRNKTFKIILTQSILQDLTTAEEQNHVIEATHDRAHRGIEENHAVIIKKFYFPQMRSKIRSFINLCETCLSNKYERNPYKLKLAETPIPRKPLDIVHIDIFISTPNLFLSAVDKLSRFAMLIPLKSRSIPDVKKSITKLITTYGTPCMIVCDNEVSFKSVEIRGLLQRLNVEIYFTPSNCSEMNGIVERFHSTLTEIFLCIRSKYNDLSDKEIYKIATSLYNTTVHTATKLKPIEVFFGIKEGDERPLNLERILENRNELFDEITNKIQQYQQKTIASHNKKREDEPILEPDQSVFHRAQGIRNKKRAKYNKQRVRHNKIKTFIDYRNIRLHKSKMKKLRKP